MRSIEIVDGARLFDTISSEWDALFEASPFATPFQSRLWVRHWLKHFRPNSSLRTILIREGSDLVGLFPLVKRVSPWMALRPAGIGPSDYLGPLMLSDDEASLLAMVDAVHQLGRQNLIDLHQLPDDHPFTSRVSHEPTIDQASCLVLDLPPTFESYVAGLSKSLRYDVRRLGGKALKERNAVVEWATSETAPEFASQFFELHKARWKSRGLPGAFLGKGEEFQRQWIVDGVTRGTVVMNRLVCGGRSVGSVYAMRHGSTLYFYQAGMDPQASSLSPGTILVAKMIERAIDTGCTTFDFMRGDEPYKRRWKPTRERVNKRILLSSGNVVGNAGKQWNTIACRVELKVRERLEGKSLRPSKAPKQTS